MNLSYLYDEIRKKQPKYEALCINKINHLSTLEKNFK